MQAQIQSLSMQTYEETEVASENMGGFHLLNVLIFQTEGKSKIPVLPWITK